MKLFVAVYSAIEIFLFSDLRKKLSSKIIIRFSSSLLALLITFLASIERVKPNIGCRFTAALIQYFLLTTFFWMSVEAWNLYRNFLKNYRGTEGEKKFIIHSSLFAWGRFL